MHSSRKRSWIDTSLRHVSLEAWAPFRSRQGQRPREETSFHSKIIRHLAVPLPHYHHPRQDYSVFPVAAQRLLLRLVNVFVNVAPLFHQSLRESLQRAAAP